MHLIDLLLILLVVCAVLLAVRSIHKRRKEGGGCSCGCGGCSLQDSCSQAGGRKEHH